MANKLTEAQEAEKYREWKAKEKRYGKAQQIAIRRAKAKGLWPTEAEVDQEIKNPGSVV